MSTARSAARAEVHAKICGLTRPRDAALAADLGADYLGLNFSSVSPRCISIDQGREIAAAVAGRARLVGVFVDQPADEITEIAERVGLDLVQLCGDEPAGLLTRFAGRAIKAFRTGGDPGPAALAACREAWAVLVDASHAGLYGGTGVAWSYAAVATLARDHRLFLAGGLGPDNVRQALAACRPYAVDVCSRIESAPGVKDPDLLRRFLTEVKHAQTDTPP